MSDKGISRRQFITGAAVVAAATAVPVVSSISSAHAAPIVIPVLVPGAPDWTPLDPKALARQAYEVYKGKHTGQSACCEASWWPIIGELANRYPTTWGNMPKGVFNFGGGGVNGWRAQCGCTNGIPAMLKMVTGSSAAMDEFLAWYEKTFLPTNATYLDYRSGTWTPGGTTGGVWGGTGLPIPYNNIPKSKSGSILCHVSLEKWRVAGGSYEANTVGAQSDRCGKLCYDAVYKAAQMVNSFMAGGTFVNTLDPSVASCTPSGCHGTNAATGHPYVDSKMKCTSCHDERVGDSHNL